MLGGFFPLYPILKRQMPPPPLQATTLSESSLQKTTINCNPIKSPLSKLLISRVLLLALASSMGLAECCWQWMGSGCCGSRVLKVASKTPPSHPNTLCYPTFVVFKGHVTRAGPNENKRRVNSWILQERWRCSCFSCWSNVFATCRLDRLHVGRTRTGYHTPG